MVSYSSRFLDLIEQLRQYTYDHVGDVASGRDEMMNYEWRQLDL